MKSLPDNLGTTGPKEINLPAIYLKRLLYQSSKYARYFGLENFSVSIRIDHTAFLTTGKTRSAIDQPLSKRQNRKIFYKFYELTIFAAMLSKSYIISAQFTTMQQD